MKQWPASSNLDSGTFVCPSSSDLVSSKLGCSGWFIDLLSLSIFPVRGHRFKWLIIDDLRLSILHPVYIFQTEQGFCAGLALWPLTSCHQEEERLKLHAVRCHSMYTWIDSAHVVTFLTPSISIDFLSFSLATAKTNKPVKVGWMDHFCIWTQAHTQKSTDNVTLTFYWTSAQGIVCAGGCAHMIFLFTTAETKPKQADKNRESCDAGRKTNDELHIHCTIYFAN